MKNCFYSPLLNEVICNGGQVREDLPKKNELSDKLLELADRLSQLCDDVSDKVEWTDSVIEVVDQCVRQSYRLGVCPRTVIVGPVAIRRAYGMGGPSEISELIQPVIATNLGCGAAFWSSDDYQEWQGNCGEDVDVIRRSKPLRECRPAVRTALIEHIPELLGILLRRVQKKLVTM